MASRQWLRRNASVTNARCVASYLPHAPGQRFHGTLVQPSVTSSACGLSARERRHNCLHTPRRNTKATAPPPQPAARRGGHHDVCAPHASAHTAEYQTRAPRLHGSVPRPGSWCHCPGRAGPPRSSENRPWLARRASGHSRGPRGSIANSFKERSLRLIRSGSGNSPTHCVMMAPCSRSNLLPT